MKKFLVTGGSGFCGSHLVDYASQFCDEIIVFDTVTPEWAMPRNARYVHGDIRYPDMLDSAMTGVEAVFDFAGYLGTSELGSMKAAAVDVNIRGAVNVFEACKKHGVQYIYHPTKNMFATDHENMYTITKFTAEKIAQMYKEKYGQSILIMRFLNVSGPRQHLMPIRKMLPLVCTAALLGKNIVVYGDGEQTMDVVDVRDVARLIYDAIFTLGNDPEILEVGYGQKRTVNQIVADIIRLADSKSEVVYVPMREGEMKNTNLVANLQNLRMKMPDFEFRYTYEQCLKDTIEYYRHLIKRVPDMVENAMRHFNL